MTTSKKEGAGVLPPIETAAKRRRQAGGLEPPAVEPRRIIVIRGREYEFPREFTGRELAWIQQETGVRAGEIEDAAGAGDVQLLLCFAVVAARRAGVDDLTLDDLLDLTFGADDETGIDFREEVPDPTDAADAAASSTSRGGGRGTPGS